MRLTILFIITTSFMFLVFNSCNEKKNQIQKSGSINLSTINEFKNDVIKKYNEFRLIHSKSESIKKIIEWIKKNDIVKETNISEDHDTIWIIFNNGVEIDIVVK